MFTIVFYSQTSNLVSIAFFTRLTPMRISPFHKRITVYELLFFTHSLLFYVFVQSKLAIFLAINHTILPLFYTRDFNRFTFYTHTHTHTHTVCLSVSLSLSLPPSFSLSHTLSLSLFLSLTHSLYFMCL